MAFKLLVLCAVALIIASAAVKFPGQRIAAVIHKTTVERIDQEQGKRVISSIRDRLLNIYHEKRQILDDIISGMKDDNVQANACQRNRNIGRKPRKSLFTRGGMNKKKRVLILMSDTGGGHRASAQAIDQAIAEQYPGKIEVDIMDIWTDYAKPPFNKFVPYYRFMAKHPFFWRLFYWYGLFPPTKLFTECWSWQSSYKAFQGAITSANPDLVVSVHPLCHYMPLSIVKDMNKERCKDKKQLRIPFVTVVTDLGGAHSTWFDKRSDVVFVPSDAVKKLALRNGVKEDRMVMHGLPIRPAFWKEARPKNILRKALGLTQKVKTVLLMGGGDGVGGLNNIAAEVATRLGTLTKNSTQLIVITGHNKQVADELTAKSWPKNVRVLVKGFCNNIDEYMAASDCLVTKAGPGTIAEAMIRGLPVVLSSFLPGQVSE
jgi:1,2-diacylglycerol 3-beta-galactosyltransferase